VKITVTLSDSKMTGVSSPRIARKKPTQAYHCKNAPSEE